MFHKIYWGGTMFHKHPALDDDLALGNDLPLAGKGMLRTPLLIKDMSP